jgi:TonB family protein
MGVYRSLAALLLALTPAVADGTTPGDRAPVALYTPPLQTPFEAAGTGLAPEVTVKVVVDADGRVSSVEVLSIQPPTEYDEFFSESARKTLLRWRYAPAIRDGQPSETTLTWMVQFPTIEEKKETGVFETDMAWRRFDASERGMRSLRQRILALSTSQRAKLLEEQATIARAFLTQADIKQLTSPRFMVFTDAPTRDIAEKLAGNLEATFDTLQVLLGEQLDPQPEPYRIIAFLYATRDGFENLKRRVEAVEWSAGFYNPTGMLAFHMQMHSNQSLLGIMLHEATHAYLDRYLSRPGVIFPRWLDEGLAEYIGNSEIKNGQLIPGRTRRAEIYRTPFGAAKGKSTARLTVEQVKRAVKEGRAMSLESLIAADIEEFYGEQHELYYPMSWLLIHFMRHGREEWDDGRFSRLMLYVAEGYPAAGAFRSVYGDPALLEGEFRAYIKRF